MSDRASTEVSSFRRHITHAKLSDLYDYWLSRRGTHFAMLRRDLDPIAIPKLLQNLILSDVGNEGDDIRYRLVGTEIAKAHGFDYTGLTIEELTSGPTLDFTRTLYRTVVTKMVPIFSEGHFQWPDRQYNWTKRLHLPITKSGDSVDMVLCGQVFGARGQNSGEQILEATPEEISADHCKPNLDI